MFTTPKLAQTDDDLSNMPVKGNSAVVVLYDGPLTVMTLNFCNDLVIMKRQSYNPSFLHDSKTVIMPFNSNKPFHDYRQTSNFKTQQIPTLNCFSSRLAFFSAKSIVMSRMKM